MYEKPFLASVAHMIVTNIHNKIIDMIDIPVENSILIDGFTVENTAGMRQLIMLLSVLLTC